MTDSINDAHGGRLVNLLVNEERELAMPSGVKLMNGLADANLFVASACGGGGTCAQCKCIISEGGGSMLPTRSRAMLKKLYTMPRSASNAVSPSRASAH